MRKSLLYVGNKLSNLGKTPTLIETLEPLFVKGGYQVFSISNKKSKVLRLFDMLYSTLKLIHKVDIVLIDTYSTQNFYYAVMIGNICRLFNTPYIPILHGGNLPNRLKNSPAQSKKLFGGAMQNVAPSMYLMNTFVKQGYTNVAHIPNTIELKNYPFKTREILAPKLLWVRSFSEIYNPILALNILERLLVEYPDAELCMVGPEKDGTQKACREYALKNSLPVKFTNGLSKTDWITLSSHYDIFINTTNFDNTPVSVIEAMALGLPIITTNVGGIPYLVDDNKDGLLVPPNNVDAFVSNISSLLQDDSLVLKLTKNARIKAESFDWQLVKHRWFKLLND